MGAGFDVLYPKDEGDNVVGEVESVAEGFQFLESGNLISERELEGFQSS